MGGPAIPLDTGSSWARQAELRGGHAVQRGRCSQEVEAAPTDVTLDIWSVFDKAEVDLFATEENAH